ncbi:hypothetical protein D3C72_2092490 [compost metagenome]
MQVGLGDAHFDHYLWALALGREEVGIQRFVAQACGAIHPQGFIHTRDHEQQADARVTQQVGQGVEPVVAARIGQQQGVGIG